MNQNLMYNDKGEPFVINYLYTENKRRYACVEFINTGTIDYFRADATKNGQIKDRYAKSVMGMFSIGRAKKISNKKEYNLWHHMLERCYAEDNKSYKDYGAKGVKVCDRWHCFEYFLNDIPLIDGYNEDGFKEGFLQLDKDIKQPSYEVKIYSLDTCTFVSREENMAERWGREII